MKNRKLTIAENCLKYGVGAFNIDACRIGTSENLNGGTYAKNPTIKKEDAGSFFKAPSNKDYVQPTGRFPASIILSHTADCQLLGFEDDTRSGGERTTTCHSGKETISGGEGTGGTMKETSQVPKWNCSPQCPCKLLDEQAEGASRFFKQLESDITNYYT